MRQVLLVLALALMAAGAVVALSAGTHRRLSRWATYGAATGGSALVAAAGVLCVTGQPMTVDLGNLAAFSQTSLRLDQLAGIFLTLTGGLGTLVSLTLLAGWEPVQRPGSRATGASYMLLLGSVTVTIVAADAFSFLFAWESLTLSFYLLSAASRSADDQPVSAWATIAIGKAGGAALLIGLLLLAGSTGSFSFSSWATVPAGALHATAYALVVFGFGTKVGLVPFQVWMPRGYPAAPGPVRAAMAGLAVNAGFYGLWRFLGVLGKPPEWLAVLVLATGGVTALLGITFAAVQSDVNCVLAYSSAENGGLILVAYGLALAGAYVGNTSLVAAGLLAGSLQVLAHAVAKTGLFLGSAGFERSSGTTLLGRLGGMARSAPWSAASLAAGAVTLAGLPPTIGFVSEWFIFEALMQQFRLHPLALRFATASAGALVALTAGVAALTFVRLLGFSVLGRPPQGLAPQRTAGEGGLPAKAALAMMTAACLGLAAVTPLVIRFMARGLSPDVPRSLTLGALKSPWVVQPVFANFSALSPTWLFIVLPTGLAVVTGATVVASRGRFLKVRRVPAWRSATPGVQGADSYTAFAYANPIRRVLANVLGTQKEVTTLVTVRAPAADDSPEASAGEDEVSEEDQHTHVVYTASIADPVESYLYRPAIRAYLTLVAAAKKLQSGRLESYVAYMLVALVALLVVAAAMG